MKDEATGYCLAIKTGRHLQHQDVKRVLRELITRYGRPRAILSDNGSELLAGALREELKKHAIKLANIEPGKPWQNAVAESFINRLRNDCLGVEWFNHRLEAKVIIERWRQEYNQERPHSSNDYITPSKKRQIWLKSIGHKASGWYEQQPRRLSL